MNRFLTSLLLCVATAGCGLDRLDHLGKPPTISPISQSRHAIDPNIAQHPMYKPNDPYGVLNRRYQTPPQGQAAYAQNLGVSRAPQQSLGIAYRPQPATSQQASLWSSSPQSLFGDRRARGVGDILTVVVQISDEAQLANTTSRSRSGTENAQISGLLGVDQVINDFLPDDLSLTPGIGTTSDSDSQGRGQVQRNEEISLRIAATVLDVLPNGHFIVTGNQEVRVNYELRDLQVAGIIRPEDISRRNEITYDKMANARIAYGGRGQINDLQQPRIGQQIVDIIAPF